MEKIGFIGSFDKIDVIMYVAKILVEMGKKVLIIDATVNQKAKYVIPTIDNDSTSYITNYLDIDIAVGFEDYYGIKRYLGMPASAVLTYDYIFIDIDNPELLSSFAIHESKINYFVTSSDLFSLKRGLEVIRDTTTPLYLTKVYFSNQMSKAEDEYLNFLSLGYKVNWQDEKIYFPLQNEDHDIIMENQRLSRIKFKGLSSSFRDALIYLTQEICNDPSEVKRLYKQIEKGV